MRLRFKKEKQKGIIPVIVAIILAAVALVALIGIAAFIAWLGQLVAGLTGGGDQPAGNSNYGIGNCAITQNLNGAAIPEGGKGKLVLEQHLATDAESFPGGWPSSSHDQDDRHYQITNFSVNCTGCIKEGFTPAEGGGSVGQGTGEKPPASAEPWIMNMRANFPRGTKIIINSTKTGKSIVAAGGYEYGPASHEYIGGAQPEVLNALGILNGDRTVTIGFAQDQSVPYGPITCADLNALAATGPCSQRIVSIAVHEADIGYRGTKCSGRDKNDIQKYCSGCTAWCSCFVTWVYKQAGYLNNTVPGPIDLKDNYQSRITVISPNGNPSLIHPGDIFWVRSSAAGSGWHVGIVERVAVNNIYTIEGNVTGDVVARRIKSASEIVYVARPKNCI